MDIVAKYKYFPNTMIYVIFYINGLYFRGYLKNNQITDIRELIWTKKNYFTGISLDGMDQYMSRYIQKIIDYPAILVDIINVNACINKHKRLIKIKKIL